MLKYSDFRQSLVSNGKFSQRNVGCCPIPKTRHLSSKLMDSGLNMTSGYEHSFHWSFDNERGRVCVNIFFSYYQSSLVISFYHPVYQPVCVCVCSLNWLMSSLLGWWALQGQTNICQETEPNRTSWSWTLALSALYPHQLSKCGNTLLLVQVTRLCLLQWHCTG